MSNVLELREVFVEVRPPYDAGLRGISLRLAPGELVLIRTPEGAPVTPLADVASGLTPAEAGAALFEGREWTTCSAHDAAVARGRIGRVFERAGWLSNLDVDENLTLAQRYHARRDPAEALAEAQALARELGIAAIPPGRPAFVDRAVLQRAQWIRALMGAPSLLLLERPARDVGAADAESLVRAVNRRREQHGVAVLWLTDSHERLTDSALRPTRKCAMEEGALRPMEPA